MGTFSEPPLNAGSLAARLKRAHFWARRDLHPLLAKDALLAAKAVARARVHRVVPEPVQDILTPTYGPSILNRMYEHPPIVALAPELASELFVVEPRPPLATALTMLGNSPSDSLLFMVLRTELQREHFVDAFAVLEHIKPLRLWRVLGPLAACTAAGALSIAMWSPAPWIGVALAVFWIGLGIPRVPEFARVQWRRTSLGWTHGWAHRLQYAPHLKMASEIVQYYEDVRGVTVDNFHVHAARPQDPALERDMHAALNKLGMEMRASRTSGLYTDYWSDQGHSYGLLEWQEPDQDPAEIQHGSTAPRHKEADPQRVQRVR